MHPDPVIALALAKQRAAMLEQQAADAALITSIRPRRASNDRRPLRRKRRYVPTWRPAG